MREGPTWAGLVLLRPRHAGTATPYKAEMKGDIKLVLETAVDEAPVKATLIRKE